MKRHHEEFTKKELQKTRSPNEQVIAEFVMLIPFREGSHLFHFVFTSCSMPKFFQIMKGAMDQWEKIFQILRNHLATIDATVHFRVNLASEKANIMTGGLLTTIRSSSDRSC